MTTNPRPRPAFANDSTLPAVQVSPAPVLAHTLRPKPKQKDKGSHRRDQQPRSGGKEVALVVRLPKPVRKRLRAKASELGMSAEEAAAQVVRMWVDG
ncbi:MAG: hypothetical protein ABWZ26_01260 [Candidatus Nanopelagicales bacterium]